MEKIKHYFTVVNGATPKSGEESFWNGDITWITPADYSSSDQFIYKSQRTITHSGLDSCGTTLVPVGSVVVSNRAPIGLVSIAGVPLCTSQGCKCLVKKKSISSKYIYYYLLTQERNLNALGRGTTFLELSSFDLSNYPVNVPKTREQETIVYYLDRKTAQIDSIIADKEKLIELLKEKRQAIISEAVTRGLDSSAPMKDSGVDWIGQIPKHWEMSQSRWLFSLRKDRAFPDDEQLTASQQLGIVYQKDYMEQGSRVVQVITGEDILKHVEPNDFVISMRSFQGGIEWSGLRGKISSAYVMLIPDQRLVYCPFFKWLLKSDKYIRALQSTSNLVRDGQALRYSNFKQVPLPIISLDEQEQISNYIDMKTSQIDGLFQDISSQIVLLKEYRQSVISEAVTGKIKIPGGDIA